MLWLSLVFADLALESLPGLIDCADPWVVETQGRVHACNPAAWQAGIRPGHGLSAALALAPRLQAHPRDSAAEQRSLHARAEWALGLSAEVVVEEPAALAVEIGGSLRYFGGLQAILTRLQQGLAVRRYRYDWAVAGTPLAALWLARGRPATILTPDADLRQVLGQLPSTVLGLSPTQQEHLHGVGLDTLADCLRMPAAALARRFGQALPGALARALGQMPDPRRYFAPAEVFQRSADLPAPVQDIALCLPILAQFLPDVVDWAGRQGRVVTRLGVELRHERHPATPWVLGFAGSRRLEHLQWVLQEQVQRIQVPAPIVGLGVRILDSAVSEEPTPDLLPGAPVRLREGQELLERLRARLGPQAVSGLCLRNDHRPERAWCYGEPGQAEQSGQGQAGRSGRGATVPAKDTQACVPANHLPRPLWLLEPVRDLGLGSLPCLRRPLRLLSGPERIESGWWDGSDVARDYFIAADQDGPQYWVYRDCRGEGRWFLQGVFA